jgi:hypothetical protein
VKLRTQIRQELFLINSGLDRGARLIRQRPGLSVAVYWAGVGYEGPDLSDAEAKCLRLLALPREGPHVWKFNNLAAGLGGPALIGTHDVSGRTPKRGCVIGRCFGKTGPLVVSFGTGRGAQVEILANRSNFLRREPFPGRTG